MHRLKTGGEGSFTLFRQICQTCTIFNFQLSVLIYSCDLLMIIAPVAAWSAWPVPLALKMHFVTF